FFSSRRRHTRFSRDWSSDVCSSDLLLLIAEEREGADQAGFRRGVTEIIGQHQQVQLAKPQVGRAVLMLLKVAAEHGIHLPPELEIGRASCRERGKVGVVGGSWGRCR